MTVVVSEDIDVIALLLAKVDLHNGQLFQKSETQNGRRFLDIKQLRSVLSSNKKGFRLIKALRLLKE